MSSDLELLARWRDGDVGAGNVLFNRHFGAVCRFFVATNVDGIDDAVQATFLACIEGKTTDIVNFRAYLFGIARNVLRRRFRDRDRDGRFRGMMENSVADLRTSPSTFVARDEQCQLLHGAIVRLPLDLQIIVQLVYWERLTIRDVADVVDIPEGTAKTRLRRAKELLARELGNSTAAAAMVREVTVDMDKWTRLLGERILGASASPA
ncbi:MAG: sigma-70 family RNA polymerase sigma factor [Deltaproteobacteria bacterium]|nr:sigma-70 family RNA polymerase sigma factor [Deltaproteobacteria bacterium]